MRTKKPWLTLMALLACLSLVAAACGDDEDDASTSETTEQTDEGGATTAGGSGGETETTMGDEMGGETEAAEPVGPACGEIPADGEGSSAGMADDPAATAASNNPLLSTLVAAVTAADLGDALNDTSAEYTIFAPIDPAFDALPEGTVESLTTDPAQMEALTDILTFHVVEGKMDAAALLEAGEVTALNGDTLTVEASGETATVNGEATVVCANVATANATVHLIDAVLMPPAA